MNFFRARDRDFDFIKLFGSSDLRTKETHYFLHSILFVTPRQQHTLGIFYYLSSKEFPGGHTAGEILMLLFRPVRRSSPATGVPSP